MQELMNEVANENNHTDNKESSVVPKTKVHRTKTSNKLAKISNSEKIQRIKKTTSNISNDKIPFPFGDCRVCADKATGAHYGVPTCEGCKGFFKRSILKQEKYRCYFGDKCAINSDNRNRCKSCRFKKCVAEGMSVKAVRMGRIPKLVKQKALAEHASSSIENDDPIPSSPIAIPQININSDNPRINDAPSLLIDEQYLFFELDKAPIDNKFQPKTPELIIQHATTCCHGYKLPDNSSIDEKREDTMNINDSTIVKLNHLALTNYMTNCEVHFSKNAIDIMKIIVQKITHPTTSIELDYIESSFIRYVRWKMFDLVNKYNGRTKQLIERMNALINLKVTDFPGNSSSVQEIWMGLQDAIPYHVKNLIAFAREMPGVNEINDEDFRKMMNNRLFDFWLIKHAPLMRDGESYMMLPNGLQYTRRWMNIIIGEEMVHAMFDFAGKFNRLCLTEEEHALIFPVVICIKDEAIDDQATVSSIQYCYLYALYVQMLATRSENQAKDFFRSLLQVFAVLSSFNDVQAKASILFSVSNCNSI